MSLYVMLSTLSESGRKVLRERPGWIRKVNADVERMGARVVAQYAVLGPYDFITVIEAPDDFMLVVSYNPGYQSILKDLKQSTRQRFVAMEFDYPNAEAEAEIVAKEGGIDIDTAADLVRVGRVDALGRGAVVLALLCAHARTPWWSYDYLKYAGRGPWLGNVRPL